MCVTGYPAIGRLYVVPTPIGYRITGQTATGEMIDRHLPTREEANHLIDQVRANRGWIESVIPSVTSLEDVFIRTAGDDKAA